MLNENIKALRKSKGLSQQDLADKLNVVRQTISKWEQGLSVPDSDLLIALSEALETPVSTLLGETVTESEVGSGPSQGPLGKVGDYQFAVCPEEGHAALGPPLAAHRSMLGHPGCCGHSGRGEQPLPGLGLQRPGDRRHGRGHPRL